MNRKKSHKHDPFITLQSLGGVWLVVVRRSQRRKYGAHWHEVL